MVEFKGEKLAPVQDISKPVNFAAKSTSAFTRT